MKNKYKIIIIFIILSFLIVGAYMVNSPELNEDNQNNTTQENTNNSIVLSDIDFQSIEIIVNKDNIVVNNMSNADTIIVEKYNEILRINDEGIYEWDEKPSPPTRYSVFARSSSSDRRYLVRQDTIELEQP
jgi:uncharacterized membrane protein